jgi:hypothetical protein
LVEALLKLVVSAVGYAVQAALEMLLFSAFPRRGQTFPDWWRTKSLPGKLLCFPVWLFWSLLVVGFIGVTFEIVSGWITNRWS